MAFYAFQSQKQHNISVYLVIPIQCGDMAVVRIKRVGNKKQSGIQKTSLLPC